MKTQWHVRCIWNMFRVLFLLLFAAILLSPAWGQEPPSPEVVIPEKVFQFKEVEEGKSVEHTFTVLNRGREPLKIIKVRPG